MHERPGGRRQVDPRVDVATRAERIEWLEGEHCAAEGLGEHRAYHDRIDWKPRVVDQPRCGEKPREPQGRRDDNDSQRERHAACRTACSTWLTLWWRSDSSL